jgi:hypothetical protein
LLDKAPLENDKIDSDQLKTVSSKNNTNTLVSTTDVNEGKKSSNTENLMKSANATQKTKKRIRSEK